MINWSNIEYLLLDQNLQEGYSTNIRLEEIEYLKFPDKHSQPENFLVNEFTNVEKIQERIKGKMRVIAGKRFDL